MTNGTAPSHSFTKAVYSGAAQRSAKKMTIEYTTSSPTKLQKVAPKINSTGAAGPAKR
jgi:hypothetical protein